MKQLALQMKCIFLQIWQYDISTKKISVFKNLSNYKLSKGFKVKKILIQHNIQNIVILARTPKYIYVKKYTLFKRDKKWRENSKVLD